MIEMTASFYRAVMRLHVVRPSVRNV